MVALPMKRLAVKSSRLAEFVCDVSNFLATQSEYNTFLICKTLINSQCCFGQKRDFLDIELRVLARDAKESPSKSLKNFSASSIG